MNIRLGWMTTDSIKSCVLSNFNTVYGGSEWSRQNKVTLSTLKVNIMVHTDIICSSVSWIKMETVLGIGVPMMIALSVIGLRCVYVDYLDSVVNLRSHLCVGSSLQTEL